MVPKTKEDNSRTLESTSPSRGDPDEMLNIFGNNSDMDSGTQDSHISAFRAIDALYEQEMQSNMAALTEQRRKSRRYRSAAEWAEYWPFAVGVAISCFVPQLRDFVDAFRPWGLWILFPFAAIASHAESTFSNPFIANMPLFFMFAQFPIEGLMSRIAFRGHVTPLRVLGQVIVLHFFALVELWLVSSPLTR
jgi:hypothetical protein